MEFDVVIIGSGVGGGAIALSLMPTGARILLIERGPRLAREPQNRSAEAVFVEQRYRSTETWFDGQGRPFRPGQYYFVGGHTKFYGCAMFRLRERDFEALEKPLGMIMDYSVEQKITPRAFTMDELFDDVTRGLN